MISSVVGSYPVYIKKESNAKYKIAKIAQLFGKNNGCKLAIKHAVQSQLEAGIDIISDGQVRGDMVEIFVKQIPGFKIKGNTFYISSRIAKPFGSIGANDLKLAIKYMNRTLSSMNVSDSERSKKGVKGIITGPSTLVQSCKLGPIYKDKNIAIIDMAKALKEECLYLEKAGAKLIQIDEPFLSTGLLDMNVAKDAINIISKEISIPVAIHCCGDIKNIFGNLIEFDVDIIDCEFAGHPNNLNVLDSYSNSLGNKKIGLGCIDTKKLTIDSVEDISKIIQRGIAIVGKNNLYIDPDCGMKLLDDDIAFSKLKNMVKAINSI
ncbi:5-methyltetrahydropteroyltriglutamate--homocysteine methyltransferase [Methanobrevibacter cuticularis]|uniref:5-methyltetrahydropteroyltriglutamate--homocysteine methyltransferase n=1 Tax=Methanobrevibacter cuticularis TaxID=47311 RepID=A0A166CV39_9EURY|nr:methionine synthase [Methanobrevibacter cuticularis]KZX17027.1 5-methyltetrahydropteroyltriglutamate--homocysteine methyltransferase [Methanobrevibacter cuticularis]